MKFCQICGRPLNDGEVCTCQQQQEAPQQPAQDFYPQQQYNPQQQYPQQQYPQQQYPQQQYPQQQYAQPRYAQRAPRPAAAPNPFVKALKNLPIAFKSYLKNSDKVVATAKSKKDFLLPLLYVSIFFFVNLIFSICFFARMSAPEYYEGLGFLMYIFGKSGNDFNFGLVLLAALIMTLIVAFVYITFRFLAMIILGKKPAGTAILDAVIEFGFHTIPVTMLVLTGALLSLVTAWFAAPFLGFAGAYLVVMYVSATVKDAENFSNKLIAAIIMTASVMIAVGFVFWMLHQMCVMNYSYVRLTEAEEYARSLMEQYGYYG